MAFREKNTSKIYNLLCIGEVKNANIIANQLAGRPEIMDKCQGHNTCLDTLDPDVVGLVRKLVTDLSAVYGGEYEFNKSIIAKHLNNDVGLRCSSSDLCFIGHIINSSLVKELTKNHTLKLTKDSFQQIDKVMI